MGGRTASWSLSRSRLVTTAVLVVVNLVPVPLVLTGVWLSGDVLLAYWLENIVVGFWTIIQILTARGATTAMPGSNDADNWPSGRLAVFFCFHYGMFTLVHGVFTAVIITQVGGLTGGFPTWLLMIAAMFVSHGLSCAVYWFDRGERDRVTKGRAMFRPYGRIFVMQITVIGSFFLLMRSGDGFTDEGGLDLIDGINPVVLPGLLLIVLKLILDVGAHLLQHRRQPPVVIS